MDQTYFVTASYAVSALVVGALIVWIFLSARNARAIVDRLDKNK